MSVRAVYGALVPVLALVVALGPVTATARLQPQRQSIGVVAPAPWAGTVPGAPAARIGARPDTPATQPAASSPPTGSLSLSVLHAEPVHLDSFGLPYKGQEQLFVKLNVSYQSATAPYFYFDPHNLVMTNITGTNFYPQGFIGSNQLTSKEMFVLNNGQPTTENGWIFFSSLTITNAVGLRVLYKGITQAPTGGTQPYVAAMTPPFNPTASPKRDYAVATQTALKTYLLDEALAVGYIRVHVAPLYQNGGGALPGSMRAYLQTQHDQLVADHHAFDAVPATGKDPLLLKTSVDTAFTALETTIGGIIAIHGPGVWTTLQGALDTDDEAIDGLYQTWPGAQLGNQ